MRAPTASKVKELYVRESGISYSDSEDENIQRATNVGLGQGRKRENGNKKIREDKDVIFSEQETPPDLARQPRKRPREHYDAHDDSIRDFSSILGSRTHNSMHPQRRDEWNQPPKSRNDKSLVPRDIIICSLGKCNGCGGVMHGHISGISCGRCSFASNKHRGSAFSPIARSTSSSADSPIWKTRHLSSQHRPDTCGSYSEIPDFRSPVGADAGRRRASSNHGKENAQNMGYKTPPSYRARKDENDDKSDGLPMSPEQVTQADDAIQSNESNELSVESPELMRGGNDSSSFAQRNAPGSSHSAASDDVFEAALAFVKKLQVRYCTMAY